ncbi:hypothetical protein Ancab_039354 [Ancistrocladus abbreviatus]
MWQGYLEALLGFIVLEGDLGFLITNRQRQFRQLHGNMSIAVDSVSCSWLVKNLETSL